MPLGKRIALIILKKSLLETFAKMGTNSPSTLNLPMPSNHSPGISMGSENTQIKILFDGVGSSGKSYVFDYYIIKVS